MCMGVGPPPSSHTPRGEFPFYRGHQLPLTPLIRVLPQEPSSFHAEIFLLAWLFPGLVQGTTTVMSGRGAMKMCLYLCEFIWAICVQCPWGLEGTGPHGSGVRGSCELLHGGPGNQTLVFCKSSKHFWLIHHHSRQVNLAAGVVWVHIEVVLLQLMGWSYNPWWTWTHDCPASAS